MGRGEAFRLAHPCVNQFVKHQKQAKRFDRSGVKIVVAVFRLVEVKAAEFSKAHEAGDNLFDIDVRRLMAEVDKALRLRSKLLRCRKAGSPIGNHA